VVAPGPTPAAVLQPAGSVEEKDRATSRTPGRFPSFRPAV